MPFLLAFWKPIAAVLIVAALFAAVALAKSSYDERRRDEGREEVRAEMAAAQAAQEAAWQEQKRKTEVATNERNAARRAAFKAAAERDKLAQEIADTRVPAGFVGSLRRSADEANAAGPAGQPDGPAAEPSSGADSTLGLIAGWVREVAEIHAECRDRVAAWAAFYRGLQEGQK